MTELTRKDRRDGEEHQIVDVYQLETSQYDHITGMFRKKPPGQRTPTFGEVVCNATSTVRSWRETPKRTRAIRQRLKKPGMSLHLCCSRRACMSSSHKRLDWPACSLISQAVGALRPKFLLKSDSSYARARGD